MINVKIWKKENGWNYASESDMDILEWSVAPISNFPKIPSFETST